MSQETIEKKLAYLDETKQMIGQALVTKGQTINNETPFRDYVQKVLDIQTGFDTRDATAVASEVLKGKTFYNSQGKVEGTLVPRTGDVKKFETIEEMQNDANVQEGDLAVVYRNEIGKATGDMGLINITFPSVVVLSAANTSYIRLDFSSEDGMTYASGSLTQTSFRLTIRDNLTYMSINYTSTDGITYTRKDSYDETISLSQPIYYDGTGYGEFNPLIGEFMLSDCSTFEGLFKYGLYDDEDLITGKDISNWSTKDVDNCPTVVIDISEIKALLEDRTYDNEYEAFYIQTYAMQTIKGVNCLKPIKWFAVQDHNVGGNAFGISQCCYNNKTNIIIERGSTTATSAYQKVEFFEGTQLIETKVYDQTYGNTNWKADFTLLKDDFYLFPETGKPRPIIVFGNKRVFFSTIWYYTGSTKDWVQDSFSSEISTSYRYLLAPNQLTLSDVKDIMPKKIAYGKEGIFEGDGSIFDNIPDTIMQSHYLRATVPTTNNNSYAYSGKNCYLLSANISSNDEANAYIALKNDKEVLHEMAISGNSFTRNYNHIKYVMIYTTNTANSSNYDHYVYRIDTLTNEIKVASLLNHGLINANNCYNCDEYHWYIHEGGTSNFHIFDFTDTPLHKSITTQTSPDGISIVDDIVYIVYRKSQVATIYKYDGNTVSTHMSISGLSSYNQRGCVSDKYYFVCLGNDWPYRIYDIPNKTLLYTITPDKNKINESTVNYYNLTDTFIVRDNKAYYTAISNLPLTNSHTIFYVDLSNGGITYIDLPNDGYVYVNYENLYYMDKTNYEIYILNGSVIYPFIKGNTNLLLNCKGTSKIMSVSGAADIDMTSEGIFVTDIVVNGKELWKVTNVIYPILENIEFATDSQFILWKDRADDKILMISDNTKTLTAAEYETALDTALDIRDGEVE